MIVVKVELWSAITGEKKELARMVIDNIGGTDQVGNYRARTLIGRSSDALDAALLNMPSKGGDLALDCEVEAALWTPLPNEWISCRVNAAKTKVVYTHCDGSEDVCWPCDWSDKRDPSVIAVLIGRGQ
jgi:hypothetical protein